VTIERWLLVLAAACALAAFACGLLTLVVGLWPHGWLLVGAAVVAVYAAAYALAVRAELRKVYRS
jgi:hypothetical protein